jgi:hypothetical protein
MQIDAKTPDARDSVGRIRNQRLPIQAQGVRRKRGDNCGFDVRAIQRIGFDLAEFALNANTRWRVFHQQKIAPGARHQCREPVVQADRSRGVGRAGLPPIIHFPNQAIQFRGIIHSCLRTGDATKGSLQ